MARKALNSWNKVIKLLMDLEKAWKIHQTNLIVLPDLSKVPTKGQEYLTMVINRSPFRIALPEFIRIAAGRGGIEELKIPLSEETENNDATT